MHVARSATTSWPVTLADPPLGLGVRVQSMLIVVVCRRRRARGSRRPPRRRPRSDAATASSRRSSCSDPDLDRTAHISKRARQGRHRRAIQPGKLCPLSRLTRTLALLPLPALAIFSSSSAAAASRTTGASSPPATTSTLSTPLTGSARVVVKNRGSEPVFVPEPGSRHPETAGAARRSRRLLDRVFGVHQVAQQPPGPLRTPALRLEAVHRPRGRRLSDGPRRLAASPGPGPKGDHSTSPSNLAGGDVRRRPATPPSRTTRSSRRTDAWSPSPAKSTASARSSSWTRRRSRLLRPPVTVVATGFRPGRPTATGRLHSQPGQQYCRRDARTVTIGGVERVLTAPEHGEVDRTDLLRTGGRSPSSVVRAAADERDRAPHVLLGTGTTSSATKTGTDLGALGLGVAGSLGPRVASS